MDYTQNITTIFLAPTLNITKARIEGMSYINAYVTDVGHPLDYEPYVIFLLYKPENLELFRSFIEEEYERTDLIIEDYDYDGGYVVVVYKLDDDYKDDYDLILQGKYSETSDKFQQLFPDTVTVLGKERDSVQRMVFNKDPRMIEYWENIVGNSSIGMYNLEVWPIFMIEKEILDIEQIKNNIKNKTP